MRTAVIRRGGSPTTRWRMALGPPSPHLRSVVDSYGEYQEFSTSPVSRREVPSPASVLIIELDGPLRATGAADDGSMRPVTAFLGSPGRGPALTWHAGYQHCMEIRLTLLGTYRLFGPLHELAGHIVDLDALWGQSADRLAARLAEANGWEQRFDILDDVLGAATTKGPEPDPEVMHAWTRLRDADGNVPIADLVHETAWSRNTLAGRFRAQTGLTPKAAATLLRFNRAVDMLDQTTPSLNTIALSCGYYDQAHFNRDFRALAGCSPTAWLRSRLVNLVGTGSSPDALA